MPSIYFFFPYQQFTLQNRAQLKIFIHQLFKQEKKKLNTLQYVFCSDEFLLSINRQYLNHDFYTDIITFDMAGASREVAGEIYISVERVKENAQIHQTTITEELHRVIIHGALHLCGYKDKLKADKKIMRDKENRYLQLYFSKKTASST
ncbi:MAG TPA: rRNA maturation RNase YbeY [Agriterribacter sp.]|nr:rRNA maturation RNase YbeY [Agriterribacter sp.]